MNRKLAALLVTVSALAVAVPAVSQAKKGGVPAKPHAAATTTTTTPTAPAAPAAKPAHPAQSHKCMAHNVAFVESGTVDATTASTLAAGTDGTWSGTVVVDVTKANHWAAGDKGKTVTQTFTSAKLRVRMPTGTTALTAGERVKLIGKIAAVAKKCAAPATPATPVFSKVIVHPAAK